MNSPRPSYASLPFGLRQLSSIRVLVDLTRTWALLVLCLVLAAHSNALQSTVLILLIGTLQYHLNILGHDGLHSNLFADRKWNDRVTRWWILAPQAIPLKAIRASHLHHHRTLGQYEDRDKHYYDLTFFNRTSASGFTLWIIGTFLGGMFLPLISKVLRRGTAATDEPAKQSTSDRLSEWGPVLVAQSILFLFCWAVVGSIWAYAAFWFLPLVTFMFGFNSVRSCLEHVAVEATDSPNRNFSFKSSRVERFFFSPFNMNFHAEHHAYMSVPYHQLPALRRYLHANSMYGGLILLPSYWQRFLEVRRALHSKARRRVHGFANGT